MTVVGLLPTVLGGAVGGQGRARAAGDGATTFGAALERAGRLTEGGEPIPVALTTGGGFAAAAETGQPEPAAEEGAMPTTDTGGEASASPSLPMPATSPEPAPTTQNPRTEAPQAIAASAPAQTSQTAVVSEPATGVPPRVTAGMSDALAPAGHGPRTPVRPESVPPGGPGVPGVPGVSTPTTAAFDPAASAADLAGGPVAPSAAAAGAPLEDAPRLPPVPPAPQTSSPSIAAPTAPGREADGPEPAPAPQAPAPVAVGGPASPQPVHAAVPVDAPVAQPVHRAIAAQVSPVVVSIAQRPSGSHQFTMTVNPESLGPVTIRARISPQGEVRVELLGATDAGREALRTIVADLRRDLAAVMPHASLSLAAGAGGGAETQDRGLPPGAGEGEQPAAHRQQSREHTAGRGGAERDASTARAVRMTGSAIPGAGLDVFV